MDTPSKVPRPYRNESDYWRMRRFLQAAWRVEGMRGRLVHVGDLTWQRFMYDRDDMRPNEQIALWEGMHGEVTGFGWFLPRSNEVTLQPNPSWHGSPVWVEQVRQMISWALERQATIGSVDLPLSTTFPEADSAFRAQLEACDFAPVDSPALTMFHRLLVDTIQQPPLPEGFTVRAVTESDISERVRIHREVWHPSRVTEANYRSLRASPGYDSELDIIAISPDGSAAAYALAWHDEQNKSGEFEPVGARASFRGRGLAKAVVIEGMRRLQHRGCTSAFVFTTEDRSAANRLYRSTGFEALSRWRTYSRKSSATTSA
jgi:ribosomal protein S18 acetylase RimI-like enzyme